jgi:hypothetical protein
VLSGQEDQPDAAARQLPAARLAALAQQYGLNQPIPTFSSPRGRPLVPLRSGCGAATHGDVGGSRIRSSSDCGALRGLSRLMRDAAPLVALQWEGVGMPGGRLLGREGGGAPGRGGGRGAPEGRLGGRLACTY